MKKLFFAAVMLTAFSTFAIKPTVKVNKLKFKKATCSITIVGGGTLTLECTTCATKEECEKIIRGGIPPVEPTPQPR